DSSRSSRPCWRGSGSSARANARRARPIPPKSPRNLRVILRKEVKGVGKIGDVKDVADGYATNYLLPRGFAVEASAAAIRAVTQQQESTKSRADRERAEMRELAKRLGESHLSFALKAGAQGKVFGSVTNRDIAEALSA